jgi:hypothetical protein
MVLRKGLTHMQHSGSTRLITPPLGYMITRNLESQNLSRISMIWIQHNQQKSIKIENHNR